MPIRNFVSIICMTAVATLLLTACIGYESRDILLIRQEKYSFDGVDFSSPHEVTTKVLMKKPKTLMVYACPRVDKKRISEMLDSLGKSFDGKIVYSRKSTDCQ